MRELKVYEMDNELLENSQYARIETSKGDIVLKLFGKDAPQSVMNFATLANSGFYKNLKFHRVIADFVAQGGCPYSRENSPLAGTGGPEWSIKCEVKNNPHRHIKGALSMAHAGRDTGGSQFFICFTKLPHLDGEHTIFGGIENGDSASFKVLDSIKQGDEIKNIVILKEI